MIVHPGNGAITGYKLTRSLRVRASASANLSQTLTTSATWALSVWVKRGVLGAISPIFGDGVKFLSNDTLTAGSLTTTALYRDPSNWYHLYVSNLGLYINGLLMGAVTTSSLVNPKIGSNGTNYFDGELAEFNFINGATPAVTAFGSFNSITGVWQPAKYSGSYPSGSSYVPFTDNSALTTSSNVGLGKDLSGNGNYWTTNNISITAGVTYDSMTDVPTLTSSTAANFAVLNPLQASAPALVDGNLNTPSLSAQTVYGTISAKSGKWYWEGKCTARATGLTYVGVENNTYFLSNQAWTTSVFAMQSNSQKYLAGTVTSYGSGFAAGDTIGVALDVTNDTLEFFVNGTSQGQITSVGMAQNNMRPMFQGNTATWQVNFGQRPFAHTPPSGFVALNTFNIPEGSITTSGSFTGNVSADGPSIYLNGVPTAMTINGNAVTMGTHADKTAYGFKVRSSSTSYNSTGTNTYSITTTGAKFKYANAQGNP